MDQLHPDGVFLQINCSHALIRWLAEDSADQAKEFAYSGKLCPEVRGNLLLALAYRRVPVPGFEVDIVETRDRRAYRIRDVKALFNGRASGAEAGR